MALIKWVKYPTKLCYFMDGFMSSTAGEVFFFLILLLPLSLFVGLFRSALVILLCCLALTL